jgi:copper resistance protein D
VENFLHIVAIWAHILGIALFVGPQFFLAFAWVPASRGIADLPTRVRAMRTITRRFAWIGGTGLVLIVVAGVYLISTWRDYYSQPDDVEFTSLRFGVIFIIKMNVLILMLIVVGIHTFFTGPKLIERMEEQARGEAVADEQLRKLRLQSMALSITGLVLVLAIMVMGASMSSTGYSFQEA